MQSARRDQGRQTSRADEGLSLASFVREVPLPHRAKVTEGYYEDGDTDGNREFSNGDVIDVRRVICPLVTLSYEDPVTRKVVRVSATTRNPDVRFRVLTRKETTLPPKPRHFRSVRELLDSWPYVVKCLSAQRIPCSPGEAGSESVTIQKDDELRLIRMVFDDDDGKGGSFLECRLQRTTQLVRLDQSYAGGSFVEVPDRMSYTLRELVDSAWVERDLRIDYTPDQDLAVPNGIPKNYTGVLVMEKPEILVEVCRLLRYEDGDGAKDVLSPPILVPLDCDIRISPRQGDYVGMPNDGHSLLKLQSAADSAFPVPARIVGWTEQSGILVNHVTRPGDRVIIYGRAAIDRVLAYGGGKYFLIPTSHVGSFVRVPGKGREPPKVQLSSIGGESFPFNVQYHGNNTYANTRDDLPLSGTVLTFSAFLKADPCVVVSKLFGDVIGDGFHLPLTTNVTIQLQKRLRNGAKDPSRMSVFDSCSEEISESTYNKLMKSSPSKRASAARDLTTERTTACEGPPVPPRASSNKAATVNRTEERPQAPTPVEKPKKKDDDSDDDHEYTYIDAALVEAERRKSLSNSIKYAGVVIPSNGNISHFSVDEMLSFLKENSVPGKTISSWKKGGINGLAFATMDDEELASRGIATPVIKFFRDRSRIHVVLNEGGLQML